MLLNAVFLISLFVLVSLIFFLWSGFLKLGLLWAKARSNTWKEVFVTTALCFAWSIFVAIAFGYCFTKTPKTELFQALLQSAISLSGGLFIIRQRFQTGIFGAFAAWLPTNLCVPILLLHGYFVWRPFLFQSYLVPNATMAPTLIGPHHQSSCPVCDSTCRCLAFQKMHRFTRLDPQPRQMICENFHVSSHEPSAKVYESDRFVAAKFVSPRRWDLMVFKSPENPEHTEVKRLVGLPGEQVYIEDGQLFVDGLRIERPSYLANLQYQEIPQHYFSPHGSKENPAQLGNDEFFVLGDFSIHALDSRYWQHGAPGHSPFAVPRSNIIGVAINVYWPWSRIRSLYQ